MNGRELDNHGVGSLVGWNLLLSLKTRHSWRMAETGREALIWFVIPVRPWNRWHIFPRILNKYQMNTLAAFECNLLFSYAGIFKRGTEVENRRN